MRRIWRPWWLWECYRHGMYSTTCDLADDEAAELYAYFLRDSEWFRDSARRVVKTWRHSCEHFLSNVRMNRVAWIGQSSMCLATSVPRRFRYGFRYLTGSEQAAANRVAQEVVTAWELGNVLPNTCRSGPGKDTQKTSPTRYRKFWSMKGLPPRIGQLPLRF